MKRIKKYYKKILLFALMLTATIGACFGIGKTFAYEIQENGDIKSSNLFHSNAVESVNNVLFTFDNSTLTINGSWNGSSDLYYGYNLLSDLALNQSYTISFTTDNHNIMYDAWINGSHYYCDYDTPMVINDLTSSIKNANWRFVLPVRNYNYVDIKIMINKGTNALAYEPFGIWKKDEVDNSLSYVFNGARAELFQSSNDTLIMEEYVNLSNTSIFQLSTDLVSIKNYLVAQNQNNTTNKYYIIIYLNSVVNTSLVVETGDTTIANNLIVSNGSSYSQSFSKMEQKTTILGTPNEYYNIVEITELYPPDYYDFSISFSLSDVSYSIGYNDGYKNGYQSNNVNAEKSGYERGYNDGLSSNVETGGMKTLFNSILSYPVNMIRGVFNFEFMGINIASLILFIVSIGIVIFVIKRFK